MKECLICNGLETVYDEEGGEISCPCVPTGIVEIIGPDGRVHYTRPADHKDVLEVAGKPGYLLRSCKMEEG